MSRVLVVIVFGVGACVSTPFQAPPVDGGAWVDGGSLVAPDAGSLAATHCSGTADSGFGLPPGSGCSADRALMTCADAGASAVCLSDGATDCVGAGLGAPGSMACQDGCADAQYGVECGGAVSPADAGGSPPPSFLLPTGCNAALVAPDGTAFYCCPCP